MEHAANLPGGIVTFLFTDLEGSTALWDRRPAAAETALKSLDALTRDVLSRHRGHIIGERSEGDSVFSVFQRAGDAAAAAIEFQERIRGAQWPTEAPPAVRVAIHSAECEPEAGGYYGLAVNRCARVRSLAHGGQVLLTRAAANLVADGLPVEASLLDLGEHRLRDLQRAEQVFQLCHNGLRNDFPPLKSLSTLPNNLPQQLTSFIGREHEMTEVKRLLERTRLLTLTGAGGTGKTRLSLQLAAEVMDSYADGVWFVELAALTDPQLLPQLVADTLRLRDDPGLLPLDELALGIGDRELLLILDNCEHLLDACSRLAAELLRRCPGLRILATSRQGLGIAGEQTFWVPSLALPYGVIDRLSPADLAQFESVRLFCDRARSLDPRFVLDAETAPSVALICSRLDGIPLAIELAAARIKALPVAAIADRLDDRFRLLSGGSRTALPRQQTLRALFDWSYDLLTEPERRLQRHLAVFASGFTLTAAEAVTAIDGMEDWEVLDLLLSLVEKSLVIAENPSGDGEARYRLLESVRLYGQERLSDPAIRCELRERHLAEYTRIAEEANNERDAVGSERWLAKLDRELDNFRAAVEFASLGDAPVERVELGLRLMIALQRYWEVRGHFIEARRRLDILLAHPSAPDALLRSRALRVAGWFSCKQGNYVDARSLADESLRLAREAGDRVELAVALNLAGAVSAQDGDFPLAREHSNEALSLWRELHDEGGITGSLQTLGSLALKLNDLDTAELHFTQVLERRRADADRSYVASSLLDLGHLARMRGDLKSARGFYAEALEICRQHFDRTIIGWSVSELGRVCVMEGDLRAARTHLLESLEIWRELGNREGLTRSLEAVTGYCAASGDPVRAAELFGAAEALREVLRFALPPSDECDYDCVPALREGLGDAEFSRAWHRGRAMSADRALQTAQAIG